MLADFSSISPDGVCMSYQISASKLQTYSRCPKSYQFRYELGIKSAAFFGSAALGTALHQALAAVYRDWHYQTPIPELEWLDTCWQQYAAPLNPMQVMEGQSILHGYYRTYIATQAAMRKPLAVEGKIQGHLQVENLEFVLSGRYDRLDFLEDGLELIDYKSTKETKLPEPLQLDLQMGLYYLALSEQYQQSLKQLSLIFLRTGEKVSFSTTPTQIQQVQEAIGNLAIGLRQDQEWLPIQGDHCRRCSYARYCPALHDPPEALPCDIKSQQPLQLTFDL
jgi:putative RecB family exonuclease